MPRCVVLCDRPVNPALLLSLVLGVVVAAALVGWLLARQRAAAADAVRASRLRPWEALVLSRTDLHLAVDEYGVATLHGIAHGQRYTVRCVRPTETEARPWLVVGARRPEAGAKLWIAPHTRDGEPSLPAEPAEFPLRCETGDGDFDARLVVFSDRPAADGLLTPEVRAAMQLFPDPWITLSDAALSMKLSYLDESDLDEARVDALRTIVRGLCGPRAPRAET